MPFSYTIITLQKDGGWLAQCLGCHWEEVFETYDQAVAVISDKDCSANQPFPVIPPIHTPEELSSMKVSQ